MDEINDFGQLMDKLRDGDDHARQDAARVLHDQYQSHVLRAVRRKLATQMRRKFDSQDFAQHVWKSFFGNLPTVSRMHSPEQLVGYLARIASNKVIDESRRRLRNKKTNINREQEGEMVETAARTLDTPSQVAIAREEWKEILKDQPSHCRRILQMKVDGESNMEIAEKLGVNERTIRRVISRVRGRRK